MNEPEYGYNLDTKDLVKICIDCGTPELPSHHLAIRCVPCQTKDRRARAKENQREYDRKRRPPGQPRQKGQPRKPPKEPKPPKVHKVLEPATIKLCKEEHGQSLIASQKRCSDCGTTDIRAHHRVIRCDVCQKKHFNTNNVLAQQRYRALNHENYREMDREVQRKRRREQPERNKAYAKRAYERRKERIANMESRMKALENELGTIKWFLALLCGDEC